MNLLKLKKYEGLVSDDKYRHTVDTVNQITSKGLDTTNPDKSLTQTDGYGQKYVPLTNGTLNKCPISNSKDKCMETHINSSNHILPLVIHVVYKDI